MHHSPLFDRFSTAPRARTSIVGRARERDTVRSLILDEQAPLVTLIGPGGAGKTRLALAVVAELEAAFAHGCVFVDLGPLRNSGQVLPAIALALGLPNIGRTDTTRALIVALQPRQLLLVLDTIDHVLDVGPTLSRLLDACPALQILATSRAPLRIRGEHLVPVPPLTIPDDPEPNDDTSAIALFVARARAADPSFRLTTDNVSGVANLCRRLDGLPLAIELAAARLRLQSFAELLNELDHRLPRLTGGEADRPVRHRTMTNSIDWSYELLSEPDRQAFRRLSVFVGGFDVDAAASVTGTRAIDARAIVDRLADQSLITRVATHDTLSRFTMLDTIREFGLDRAVAGGDESTARALHAEHFLAVAERLHPGLAGSLQTAALDRLAVEWTNIREALNWALTAEATQLGLRLAVAAGSLWFVRGPVGEGLSWYQRAIAHGDPDGLSLIGAEARCEAAWLALLLGDDDRARTLFDESLATALQLEDRIIESSARNGLATVARRAGDLLLARREATAALTCLEGTEAPACVALAEISLGRVDFVAGDFVSATDHFERARDIQRATSDFWLVTSLCHLGLTYLRQSDVHQAAIALVESLRLATDGRAPAEMADAASGLAEVAAATGKSDLTALLIGATEGLSLAHTYNPSPTTASSLSSAGGEARRVLGPERFAATVAAGRAISSHELLRIAELIATSIGEDRPSSRNRTMPAVDLPTIRLRPTLSRREQEVLELLCQRLTAAEIAGELSISTRTAESHIGALYSKLGVSSRRDAIAIAARLGLA